MYKTKSTIPTRKSEHQEVLKPQNLQLNQIKQKVNVKND